METLHPDAMDNGQSDPATFANVELDPETIKARFKTIVDRLDGVSTEDSEPFRQAVAKGWGKEHAGNDGMGSSNKP